MKRRRYRLVWSRDPGNSHAGIFVLDRLGTKHFFYGRPAGIPHMVRSAKRLLRAGFAAGYQLNIEPNLVSSSMEDLALVTLAFTK